MADLSPYSRFLDSAISPAQLAEILAATPRDLDSLALAMGPQHIDRAPAPGKWSTAQILCHLADCEIAFAFRLRQTLAEDHPILQPFDRDRWASTYAATAAQQALATFTALRAWNLTLIRNAPPESANKPATHPERGTMTFTTPIETMAGQDRNHLAQLHRIAAPD